MGSLNKLIWDQNTSEAKFTDGADYRSESRPWHTVIKKELDEPRPLYYEAEGKFISFKPVSISSEKTQPTLSTKETDLVFEGVWPDAAIVIELSRDHWKKLIRIDRAPITAAEYVDYVFEVETDFKLDTRQEHVRLGEFTSMEVAQAWDSSPRYDKEGNDVENKIRIEVLWTESEGRLYLTKRIPTEWLSTAVFPVYTDVDISWGTASEFEDGDVLSHLSRSFISVAAIDSNKFVVAYFDDADGDAGKARVGTVSGTTITWGAISEFCADIALGHSTGVCKLDTDKFVVVYSDNSDDTGYARAVTVSGTTIGTWGTAKQFETGHTERPNCVQLGTDKFAIVYNDEGDSDTWKVVACTVSGTTITSGTPATLIAGDENNANQQAGICKLDTDKFAVMVSDATEDGMVYAITVSGTTCTVGTGVEISNVYVVACSLAQLGTDKFVAVWSGNTLYGNILTNVCTVSGTTITKGTEQDSTYNTYGSSLFGSTLGVTAVDTDKFIIVFEDNDDSGKGKSVYCTVSGTTVTFGSRELFHDAATETPAVCVLTNPAVAVCAYADDADAADKGEAIAGTLPSAGVEHSGAAVLAGAGTLASAGKILKAAAASVSGAGTLSVAGALILAGASVLSGTGTLTTAGDVTTTHYAASAISGVGTLTTAGTVTTSHSGAAALSGAGTLTIAGDTTTTHYAASVLSGVGTLTVSGDTTTTHSGAASLSGVGTLTIAGDTTTTHYASASLSGVGTLTATSIADPTAITQAATNITSSAARINGKVSDDGGEACDVRFRWGGTPALQEYYNTGDDGARTFSSSSVIQAQTFTTVSAYHITSAKLKLFRTGSPGTINIGITAVDGDGYPTGADLCSGTTDGDTLTTDSDGEWREITLGSGYNLAASTQYAITMSCAASDSFNRPSWRRDGSSPSYAGGTNVYSDDSGSTWIVIDADCMFEVYSGWTTSDWDETGYSTDATFYHDLTDLDSGTEYEFQVQARNTAGEGAWSASETFTTLAFVEGAAVLEGTGTLSCAGTVTSEQEGSATLEGVGTLTVSGDTTTAHSGAATLEGTGTLSATGKRDRSGRSTLEGVGTLTATGEIGAVIEGAASLEGVGTLSVIGKRDLTATSSLSGVGTLTVAGDVTTLHSGEASLTGTGSLTCEGSVERAAGASLQGAGTLSATGKLTRSGAASLSGVGSLTCEGEVSTAHAGAASLSGEGSLSAAGKLERTASASLSGVGSLTATAEVTATLEGAASLTGTGTLSATGKRERTGAVSLDGQGTLSATSGLIRASGADLTGVGSLSAIGKRDRTGSSTLEGIGTLTASATSTAALEGEASLVGTGTLSVQGSVELSGAADLEGVGTLSATAKRDITGESSLNGTGSLSVTGQLEKSGAASLTGIGTLSVEGSLEKTGASSLTGEGTLSATGSRDRSVSSSLEGVGTLSVTGKLEVYGAASLNGEGTLSASASISGIAEGQASLIGEGTLSVTGSIDYAGAANLTGAGTLSIQGGIIRSGEASLDGTGTLTATGSIGAIHEGAAVLEGTGTLVVAAGKIISGSVPMFGEGEVIVSAVLERNGHATLLGVGSLTANGTYITSGAASLSGIGTLTVSGELEEILRQQIINMSLPGRTLSTALHGRTLTTSLPGRTLTLKVRQNE